MKRTLICCNCLARATCATLIIQTPPAVSADPLVEYDNHTTAGLTQVRGSTYANPNYGYAISILQG